VGVEWAHIILIFAMNIWRHPIMLETIVFFFHYVAIFQMQEPIDHEENTRSPRHQRQKTSFKWTNLEQKKK
jgi:hypothetical protein